MAHYTMKEIAAGMLGRGERRYPRLVNEGMTDTADLATMIEHRTTFTRADVAGLLSAFTEIVAEEVAAGRTVKVSGLGTFRAVLGLVDKEDRGAWTDSANRLTTTHNVRLKTVNFRPDKFLTHYVARHMELERAGGLDAAPAPASTPAERADMARDYLQEHGFMRVTDYAALTGLARSTASVELRRLAADPASGMKALGRGPAKVYVARE